MENGWIRIYRSLLDVPWFNKPERLSLWIYLLLRANHKGKEVFLDGKTTCVLPGRFLTSRNEISKACGISSAKVQRMLMSLVNEQRIEQLTNNRYRWILIKNWEHYQKPAQQSEQRVNTNNNERNKYKKKDLKTFKLNSSTKGVEVFKFDANAHFEEIWKSYPNKRGKKAAARHFKATVKNHKDFENIKIALDKYKKDTAQRRVKFPDYQCQNGSTWFNNWVDWLEYESERDLKKRELYEWAKIKEKE